MMYSSLAAGSRIMFDLSFVCDSAFRNTEKQHHTLITKQITKSVYLVLHVFTNSR